MTHSRSHVNAEVPIQSSNTTIFLVLSRAVEDRLSDRPHLILREEQENFQSDTGASKITNRETRCPSRGSQIFKIILCRGMWLAVGFVLKASKRMLPYGQVAPSFATGLGQDRRLCNFLLSLKNQRECRYI